MGELVIDNKIITAPIVKILKQVKSELHNGKLQSIIDKGADILINCPIHKNGLESHPSCNVYAVEDNNVGYGVCHCFTCGYKANLVKLIADCFDESLDYGKSWLLERFGDLIDHSELHLESIDLTPKLPQYLDPKELDKYNYYHPYLITRKISKEIINKFCIGYDPTTNCVTFPVWDEHNNLVFITKRSIEGKHFYIAKGVDKPVYLLNFIKQSNIKEVYVVESQINALTLWTWGLPAIALFGTGTDYQYEILKHSGIRSYILCFDGDEAGDKGRDRFIKNMPQDIFIQSKIIPRNKDVNDLDYDTFTRLKLV